MSANHLPIIYVRGYAGTASAVESAVENPYYGFNDGSSKVRTGPDGDPELFLFESPLVRLMKEHAYTDLFVRVDETGKKGDPVVNLLKSEEKDTYPVRSLWIFRYYDDTSKDIGTGKRHPIEALGRQLAVLIDYVRAKTGAEKVHLVAHSMGGLVCRSAIQKTLGPTKSAERIARLFTYGTPHGGIHFRRGLGWAAGLRDLFGVNDSDNFGPEKMRKFLGFPKNHSPERLNELGGKFDPLRCFSLVGTNHEDYTVRSSKLSVGPGSDGLVMRRHAYIRGSNRAYVHRSHSGPYGLVNSEEGYQNLQRFLFGDVAVRISLAGVRPTAGVRTRADGSRLERVLIESEFAMRGEFVQMNQQLERDGSAEPVDLASIETGQETLFRAFLLGSKRPTKRYQYSQFHLVVRVIPLYVKDRRIRRDHVYAGQKLFERGLFFGVADAETDGCRRVRVAWGQMDDVLDNTAPELLDPKTTRHEIPLPLEGSFLQAGKVIFDVQPWGV